MTGSAMGPKDFELYYSFDEGDTYHELALDNQFGNIAANAKNSFTYNLEELQLAGDEIWFRIDLKEGDRTGGGTYNESTGTLRIDNLHLVGISPTSTEVFSVNKLQYFVFHKDKQGLMFVGTNDDISNLSLQLNLPVGDYEALFILNSSDQELLLPSTITKASDLYTSNVFSNKNAEIFGFSGSITVSGNMTSNIILHRLYSQIKVEFTDNIDLSHVSKIVIKQEHEPYFYSPFIADLTNPILDQSSIEIIDVFQINKQIIFNQFMGLLAESKPVHYIVEVHSENVILRTFHLESILKNNIQLVFHGELLQDPLHEVGFQITKNENWDGENAVSF
jgi:hypothetical protein